MIYICDALDHRGNPSGLSLERWTRLMFNICTGELVNQVSFMRDGTLGYHANGIFIYLEYGRTASSTSSTITSGITNCLWTTSSNSGNRSWVLLLL